MSKDMFIGAADCSTLTTRRTGMVKITVVLAIILAAAVIVPFTLDAQEQDVENLQVGIDTGTQLLADIPIAHFEDADTWNAAMPVDQGIVMSMKRKGRPLEVPAIDPNDGTSSEYVLGVKVAFNQRGYSHFRIQPERPIKVPGITKAITVWVCGRSFKHRMYLHVLDYLGKEMILDMGLLDFVGWKKVSVAIPVSIEQDNYHNTEWRGLSFAGWSVMCDPADTYGLYYLYFDELRAITDVYNEEVRDEDDMQDGW
jgi:hypothetical protein